MANTGLNTLLPKLTVTATEYNYSMMGAEIPALTVSGSATPGELGQGTCELPLLRVTGNAPPRWLCEVDLPQMSVTGSGAGAELCEFDLPLLTLTASGKQNTLVKGTFTIPGLSVTGKNGLCATLKLPLTALVATGLVGTLGTSKVKLPVLDLTATGNTPIIGTASVSLPRFAFDGTGKQENYATASISIPLLQAKPTGYAGSLASATITLPVLELDASGYLNLSATASITLPLLEVTAYVPEVIVLVNVNGDNESLSGYALVINLRNYGLTEYDNYGFNSFCYFNGQYLGANSAGIFNLTGSTDNETKIRAKVRTSLQDGGSALRKGIEDAFLGLSADDILTANVVTDDYKTYQGVSVTARADDAVTQRVKFGKGIRSRYLGIELENNNGCDFTLESIELIEVPLTRKL